MKIYLIGFQIEEFLCYGSDEDRHQIKISNFKGRFKLMNFIGFIDNNGSADTRVKLGRR